MVPRARLLVRFSLAMQLARRRDGCRAGRRTARAGTERGLAGRFVQILVGSAILWGTRPAALGPGSNCRVWFRSLVQRGDGFRMAFLTSATLDRLRDDFDAREEILRQVVADRLGANPRAERARPRRGDLLLRLSVGDARARGRGDQLSRDQRHQEPARGLAARRNARRGRPASMRSTRPGRIGLLARRVPAQDDAAPRRAPHLVRPAAHGRRRGHLRRVREPGCPADLDPDSRRRARGLSRARRTARSTSARRRASPSISRRSARS